MSDTETKRSDSGESFEIVIKRKYCKPIKERQYDSHEDKSTGKWVYDYGEWIETHENREETLLEQRVKELDLNKVIKAINGIE